MKLELLNFETAPIKGEAQSFSFGKLPEPPFQFLRTPGFFEKIIATGERETLQKLRRPASYEAAALRVEAAFCLLPWKTLFQ